MPKQTLGSAWLCHGGCFPAASEPTWHHHQPGEQNSTSGSIPGGWNNIWQVLSCHGELVANGMPWHPSQEPFMWFLGGTESSPGGWMGFCLCECPVFCHPGVKHIFCRAVIDWGSILAPEILGNFFRISFSCFFGNLC